MQQKPKSIMEYLLEEVEIKPLGLRFPWIAGAVGVGSVAYILFMGKKHYRDHYAQQQLSGRK